MVSSIKGKASIGDVCIELSLSVEGTPAIDSVQIFVNEMLVKSVVELKAFQHGLNESTDIESEEIESAEDEVGEIKPKLSVKPATSELDKKIEQKLRNDVMVG